MPQFPWQICPCSQESIPSFLHSTHAPWALLHAMHSARCWLCNSEWDPLSAPRKVTVWSEILRNRQIQLILVNAIIKVDQGPWSTSTSFGELRETSGKTSYLSIWGRSRNCKRSILFLYVPLWGIIQGYDNSTCPFTSLRVFAFKDDPIFPSFEIPRCHCFCYQQSWELNFCPRWVERHWG